MLPGYSSVWTWCFPLPCCAHSYGFNTLSKLLISKLAFHPSSLLSFRLPFQKPTGHLYPMVTQAHQLIPNWWLSKYFYLTHPKMLKQNTWHLLGSSLPRIYTFLHLIPSTHYMFCKSIHLSSTPLLIPYVLNVSLIDSWPPSNSCYGLRNFSKV